MDERTFWFGVGAFAVYLVKEIWTSTKTEIKENTRVTQLNTLALTKVEAQLSRLNDLVGEIPKLKQDIAAAHKFIRELKNSPEGRT